MYLFIRAHDVIALITKSKLAAGFEYNALYLLADTYYCSLKLSTTVEKKNKYLPCALMVAATRCRC